MPLSRPSLADLKSRNETDIISELGSGPLLPGSLLKALSTSNMGAVHGLYGYAVQLAKEALPNSSILDFLNNWGLLYGVNRAAATYASGNVTFTGENGTQIPAGTQLIGTNDISYSTQALGTIVDGAATVAITALVPGASANLDQGDSLSTLLPIAGIDSTVTVASGGLTSGSDQESDQALRDRIQNRLQKAPHGGSTNDYEQWALSISGVGKVWALPLINGAASANIYAISNDDDNPALSASKIQEIFDYITEPGRKPMPSKVYVSSPEEVALNFDIRLTPDTDEVRAAVEAGLKDLIIRERRPGVQESQSSVVGYTLPFSKIREAISTAAGEVDHSINSPSGDVSYDVGQLPKLGTITYE